MSWFSTKRPDLMSPSELNDLIREAMAEIKRQEAMGPVERDMERRTQFGWSSEDMRQAFRALGKALEAK